MKILKLHLKILQPKFSKVRAFMSLDRFVQRVLDRFTTFLFPFNLISNYWSWSNLKTLYRRRGLFFLWKDSPSWRFISSVTFIADLVQKSILLSLKHPVTTIQRVVADGRTAVHRGTRENGCHSVEEVCSSSFKVIGGGGEPTIIRPIVSILAEQRADKSSILDGRNFDEKVAPSRSSRPLPAPPSWTDDSRTERPRYFLSISWRDESCLYVRHDYIVSLNWKPDFIEARNLYIY